MSDLTRRRFCAIGAAVGPGLAIGARPRARRAEPICVFSKHLQHLTFDELARVVAGMGFDGIEAPIRPGGHIEPERVPDELPGLVEALAARDLEITVLTSGIETADQKHTRATLETAVKLGIRRYRLKGYRYDLRRSVAAQLRECRSKLAELAALNAELGIKGIYQNHSGRNHVGAPIWDIASMLDGLPAEHLGVAFDIGHATLEGSLCWPIQHNLIRPRIDTIYVKDLVLRDRRRAHARLGEGAITRRIVRDITRGHGGPISLHMERIDHRDPALGPRRVAAIETDWARLRGWLGR